MNGRRLLVLAGTVTTALLSAQAPPTAAAWRIGTDQWIAWEPLHVADQLGFWRDQDLPVELITYTGGEAPVAFERGFLDFATVMLGTSIGTCQKAATDDPIVRVIAEIDWSHGGDKIVASKTLTSLRGRRVGVYENSPAVTLFLHRWLATQQLALTDVQLVEVLDNEALVANLLAARLDAVVAYEPHVTRATVDPRFTTLASTADIPGVMPEVLAMRTDRAIPPAVVDKMLRGWIRAVLWCQDPRNGKERNRIAREHTLRGLGHTDAEILAMRENVLVHGLEALRERNLQPDGLPTAITEMIAFCRQHQGGRSLDGKAMFDPAPLRRVLAGFASAPAPAAPVRDR